MRRYLIPILMAGAMMPSASLAQEVEDEGLRAERVETGSASNERPQRVERVRNSPRERIYERPERHIQQVEQTPTVEQVQQARNGEVVSSGGHREYHRDVTLDHRDLHATDPSRREHRVYHRDQKREHKMEHRSWDLNSRSAGHGDYHGDVNREHGELHAADPTSGEHRNWHQDVSRQHDWRHSAWDMSWRSNRSYDWRGYRSRYNSIYNLPRYYDPYGWGYRRFSIGFSIGRGYYGSNYWLDDPWMYRLPPAYGPYRWVRYYDDALLVNIYSGQVVDVIHNFFW